jgi:hypothetical protein
MIFANTMRRCSTSEQPKKLGVGGDDYNKALKSGVYSLITQQQGSDLSK